MDVLGYVAASSAEALADPLAFDHDDLRLDAQQRRIEAWARRHRHRLIGVVREGAVATLDAMPDRLGLGAVLERMHEGEAEAALVARTDRLGTDVVTQELVLAEVARAGARVLSATAADAALLADPPQDPVRAAVRRAVRTTHAFHGDLRTLRARMRMRQLEDGGEIPALVEIEHMGEQGMMITELARYLRERRAAERLRPATGAWWRRRPAWRG